MQMTIIVDLYKGQAPEKPMHCRIDGPTATIGRNVDNTLVLFDPDLVVSRQHALITQENGRYFITDTSTHGTYVAKLGRLLQRDERVELTHGDTLSICDFQMQVSIGGGSAANQAPSFADEDFMSLGLPVIPDALPDLPTVAPVSPVNAFGYLEQAEAPAYQECFVLPDVDSTQSFALPADFNPGALWDQSPPSAEAAPFGGDFEDDLLAGLQGPIHAAAPAQAFPAEAPAPLAGPFSASVPEPVSVSVSVSPAFPDAPPAAAAPLPEPILQAAIDPLIPPPGIQPAPASFVPPTPAPVAQASAEPPPPPPFQSTTTDDLALLRALLEGAGIAGLPIEPDQAEEIMRRLGMALRDLVDGVMTVLRARAELKSQMRASMTVLRPLDNNPLKFLPTPEDALRVLFTPNRKGFLSTTEAVRESVDDLMQHQLAITAGTQAALADILRQFAPERIERQFSEGLVLQKKAKCWDAYVKTYPDLVQRGSEGFFGDAFVQAYERQCRMLNAAKSND